ncbi:hypothetical protein H310_11404 [Aphanomyces invadans]|uniref:Uncharacterized protein n=1 Tax=Aphanomyces invadans TaxID=157072 RepID=A0A024TNC5_9STRA|nr:hypothetical protein H310_11404 [Aphanomyces invadans]ETV95136.1 hypothetical protein H310_11404 [Aphanomyces invadans]|eukprot:XP_008876309.1 hypothetical protein H310_11404 [Aphanomyces invadans]
MGPTRPWPLDGNGSVSSPVVRWMWSTCTGCVRGARNGASLVWRRLERRPRVLRFLLAVVVLVGVGVAMWLLTPDVPVPKYSDKDTTMHKVPNFQEDRISTLWTDDSYECLGWQETDSCEPDDTVSRRPLVTKTCDDTIEQRRAGFCQVRNKTSGAILRVMVTSCHSMQHREYKCAMARNFSEFSVLAASYQHMPLATSLSLPEAQQHPPTRAILMIVYDKVLPSAYAAIRVIRDHGCTLPVEMWYRPDEMQIDDNALIQHLIRDFNVHMREIFDPRAIGFHTKPYAVFYSHYDNVLLLDADNVPVRDPTYLFDDPAFVESGALFWPDYWQPPNSLFDVTSHSLLWQLLDMEFVSEFEQESGQVLINRRRSHAALNMLMYYSTNRPKLLDNLKLVWGDKDLFRLAWRNTSTLYHMMTRPPAIGGIYSYTKRIFCGLAMIQYDPTGQIIFFHRNSIKLDGSMNQPLAITHIQQYRGDPTDYRVGQIIAELDQESCYYIRSNQTLSSGASPTYVTPIEFTAYDKVEPAAIAYSVEGRRIVEMSGGGAASWRRWLEGTGYAGLCMGGVYLGLRWWRQHEAKHYLGSNRWKSY